MQKRKSMNIETIEVKKPDGTLEQTLKWRCPVCGRFWYSKGELKKKSFFSMSQVYSPAKCPCYIIEPGSGNMGKEKKALEKGKL